MKFKRYNCR